MDFSQDVSTVEYRELNKTEMAEAVETVIRECPEIPYFAEKRSDIFIPKWGDFMQAGIAKTFGAYCDGKPVGLMLGIIMPDLLSDTKQAMECVWQVIPAYRHTGAGPVLMKMFEDAAREAGCCRTVFGASTEFEIEKMRRLYRRLGYKEISIGMAKTL